jgi:hypothetical protein
MSASVSSGDCRGGGLHCDVDTKLRGRLGGERANRGDHRVFQQVGRLIQSVNQIAFLE